MMLLLAGLASAQQGDDYEPTGRYLTPAEIHSSLSEQLQPFEDCYQYSSARGRVTVGEVHVVFTIAEDGTVSDARVHASTSELDDLDACLVEQALTLQFRPHDEAPIEVGYPFVFRDAALQPFPMVMVAERPIGLLFVYLPEDPNVAKALVGAR